MATDTLTLKQVAHAQSDLMFDVMALLSAASNREWLAIDADNDLLRLIHMASEKLTEIQSAFDPYI